MDPGVMMTAGIATAASLWALEVRRDCRAMLSAESPRRFYVPGRRWVGAAHLQRRLTRSHTLIAASTLMLAAAILQGVTGPSTPIWPLACAGASALVLAGLSLEYFTHRRRATLLFMMCNSLIALCYAVAAAAGSVSLAHLARDAATALLAQMYLVSVVQKIRSPAFLKGDVVFDMLLFASIQRASGSPEFPGALPLRLWHRHSRVLRQAARLGSRAALIGEAVLGVGVLLHIWVPILIAVCLVLHGGFAILVPRRVPAFSLAVVTMVAFAL